MVTKHPRKNVYLSSAELSHRLTLSTLTPRPPAMNKAASWWSDLIYCDKLYWGFVIGVFACAALAYFAVPNWLEWGN